MKVNTENLKVGSKFTAVGTYGGTRGIAKSKQTPLVEWTVERENRESFRVSANHAGSFWCLYLSKKTGLITK